MAIEYSPSSKLPQLPTGPLPVNVINWCETLTESTAAFDRAFTETVLDDVVFNNEGLLKVEWSCFDGGSQTLSNAVEAYLNQVNPNSIVFNQPITSITGDPSPGTSTPITIITGGPNGTTYQFDNVISTLPLPVLRVLNVTPGLLSPLQAMALRQLQYGPSIKIGIRFKSPWWTTGKDKDGKPFNIIGGQSFTDRPIRTIVYPSYGVQTPSNVLIASYCWTNDAERLQALCDAYLRDGSDTIAGQQLTDMVLSDLEDVHNLNRGTLVNEVASTPPDSGVYAWNWCHDIHTMGAFAFFGPGQFEDLYDSLNAPSPNGKLHFAGEALSIRHAWVVGALDSAWRAVNEYLTLNYQQLLPKFYAEWGTNEEWTKKSTKPGKAPDVQDDLLLEHLILHRPHLFELNKH
ncbi:hypothetical protein AX16_010432 [Volvariella volvacea WC 439]|nr:hypothetical protein AX16_010432 [Volvariella volvacea WC 439]